MIVSHAHRYVFVQVPASASTAIGRELCERYGGEPILEKHSHLSELDPGSEVRGYFAFGTLRHPLEVMVARYFKLKVDRQGFFTDPAAWVENGGHVTPRQRERFRFVHEKQAEFPEYFLRFAPRLYENPYFTGIQDRFDFVLRKERLDEDFARALARVGIEAERPIPRVNVTPAKKGHFSEYYTPDLHERAVRSFGPFMRRFGFAFPECFGDPRVPLDARIEFEVGDRVGRFCAQRLGWEPERAVDARERVRRRTRLALRRVTRGR